MLFLLFLAIISQILPETQLEFYNIPELLHMEEFRLESPTCKHLTNPTWSCVDSRLKKAIEYRAYALMDEKGGIHTSRVEMSTHGDLFQGGKNKVTV